MVKTHKLRSVRVYFPTALTGLTVSILRFFSILLKSHLGMDDNSEA